MLKYDELRAIITSYQDYRDAGGERIALPKVIHKHKKGWVSPSNLDKCPLKGALDHFEVEPKFPQYLPDLETRIKMESGNRMAEIIQEAFVWHYKDPGIYERVFEQVRDDGIQIRGRSDIVLDDQIFDVKNIMETSARWKGATLVYKGSVMQTMCYKLMSGKPFISIITISRDDIKLWDIVDQGDAVVVSDEKGNVWGEVTWAELEAEIKQQWRYIQGERAIPFADPLNHSCAFQCHKKTRYAKDETPGKFRPNCSQWCWTDDDNVFEYIKGEDRLIPLMDIF